MGNEVFCPECCEQRASEIIKRKDSIFTKGKNISYTAIFTRCLECGCEFEVSGQLDANLDSIREEYARLYESPKPEEIVALREKYNASQKAFGTILGFGELTINSYEKGAIPNSTNRLLLKLASDPYIFKAMYEINSMRIGAIQRRRIEESEGYKESEKWIGLESINQNLTDFQKIKIEDCAIFSETTIAKKIFSYVEQGSFIDYSKLVQDGNWSDKSEITIEPNKIEEVAS